MKQPYKIALAAYVFFLLWLILFKTSANPLAVLADYQSRSLNVVPFVGYSAGTARETIDNVIVFIPLGLLLSIACKHYSFWRKLAYIFIFSVMAETAQYVFAIGTTDITDVITNTLGGTVGLAAYGFVSKYSNAKKLDRFIVAVLGLLVLAFVLLRFLVFRVRY